MSFEPYFFSPRTPNLDPFGLDLCDPFHAPFVQFPLEGVHPTPVIARSGAEFPLDGVYPGHKTVIANCGDMDWKETPTAHIFTMDLPGFNKNEVKLDVERGKVLQVSAERKNEVEEKNNKWHRVERSGGMFMRRVMLPENAKVDQLKAGLENGVLTVTIPKAAEQVHSRVVELS